MFVSAKGLMRARRPRYGVDGGVGAISIFAASIGSAFGVSAWAWRRRKPLATALSATVLGFVVLVTAGYLYCSGPGKRSMWSELLDDLDLTGHEEVLDVGCGRGAVLVLAAHRLSSGRVVGVDIWRRRDQSGNSPDAPRRNADLAGVSERVEVLDGDARSLPFPAESFDVVVSNLVFHNIRDASERAEALCEVARVLRPGGRLRIVDLWGAPEYAQILWKHGCRDVTVSRLDWRSSFGIPGRHQNLVSATKVAQDRTGSG